MAEGLVSLDVPQRRYWGPSVSVMAAYGPFVVEGKQKEVRIEMQSGDVISIVALGFAIAEG